MWTTRVAGTNVSCLWASRPYQPHVPFIEPDRRKSRSASPFFAELPSAVYDASMLLTSLLVVLLAGDALILCFRLLACQCVSPPTTLRCNSPFPPKEPIQKTEHLSR